MERARLHADLDSMQALEQAALDKDLEFDAANSVGSADDEEEEDLSGDEANVPAHARAARAALARKYRHLRRALEDDQMAFADQNFEIKPLSGEIWANSEIEVAVTFRPDTAADYACSVYLDVVGRDERLSLWLSGLGIGPKGVLSYDVLGELHADAVAR